VYAGLKLLVYADSVEHMYVILHHLPPLQFRGKRIKEKILRHFLLDMQHKNNFNCHWIKIAQISNYVRCSKGLHEITHSRVSVRWCHSFKPVLTSHSHIGLSTESFMFPDQENGSRPFHSCEE
jgi:hypothetical protein